ncbi:MAG: hypothetical protein K8U03_07570 [Planctomycetia bacterium]|nr:hypothetical protein [Planctomycetia bacterium]
MNLFGKILVALNLVMSLVFMGFAVAVYSTHQNWREVVQRDPAVATPSQPKGLIFQVEEALTKNLALNERIKALTSEIAQERKLRDNRLALLETEKEKLKTEVAGKTAEIVTITEDKTKTTAAIEALTAEVAKKTADNDVLAKAVDDAKFQAENFYKDVLVRTDELAKLGAEIAKVKNQTKDVVGENTRLKTVLTAYHIDPNAPIANTPPKVDGYVKAATTDGLVEISLGSDDGLSRGHTLEVYRPGPTAGATKYLGRIEILQTKADVSVGKVIPQFRRGNIEKDDRVATRFN